MMMALLLLPKIYELLPVYLEVLAYGATCLLLIYFGRPFRNLYNHWLALKLYRFRYPKALVTQLKCMLASSRGWFYSCNFTISLATALFVIYGFTVFEIEYPIFWPAVIVASEWVWVSNYTVPPLAIFLAGSRPEAATLLDKFYREFQPSLQIVALIQDQGRKQKNDAEEFIPLVILRTGMYINWRSVVHPLIDLCPLVIMDMRVMTDAVQEELTRLIDTGMSKKSVFLTTDESHLKHDSLVLSKLVSNEAELLAHVKTVAGKLYGREFRLRNAP